MYFEKCFVYNNKKSINLSQLRRNLLRKPSLEKALEYYECLDTLPIHKIKVKKQPLFNWEYQTSCILYEILNVQHIIANEYAEKASKQSPKDARKNYINAMKFNTKCLKTLRNYRWIDNEVIKDHVMQYNYHYAKLLKNAAMNYYAMYQFKQNLPCIRRAYYFMDFSTNLWKSENNQLFKMLTTLEMAKQLPDDQMGERLALIQEFKEMNECSTYWDTWKQQNDNVFFKAVETKITIKPFTLKEAFQDLSKLLKDDSKSLQD